MKTAMVDMKKPKPPKSDKGINSPTLDYGGYEKCPYGMRVRLSSDELEKLGIDVSDLNAGQQVTIKGKCEICEVSTEECMDENGKPKKNQRLELQIQKLALQSQNSFKGGFEDEGD